MAKKINDTKSTEIASEKPKNEKKSQKVSSKVEKSTSSFPEVNELCTVFKEGDRIQDIAKALTGDVRNVYKMLDYSGVTSYEVKEGTILKWRI